MRRGAWILKCVVGIVLIVLVIGLVTQALWNWLVPVLFNGPVVTYWQALGLLALSKIFFWSFGKHHRGGRHEGPWKQYWKQKWTQMSPDEREELKKKMRDRWCTPRGGSSTPDSGSSNG